MSSGASSRIVKSVTADHPATSLCHKAALALGRGVVTVVPLTTATQNIHPFQVLIPGGPETGLVRDSKAHAEQVRAVDMRRLREPLGVPPTPGPCGESTPPCAST
ncbi:MAG: type II toxin-antitoxin system PemK/MazF family toxin [Bifidobacteriaceae bacterium]|nr:type II toxin-antitoxin system PemK/MazF family toxin [Bifidobacteriaceae bacterium]